MAAEGANLRRTIHAKIFFQSSGAVGTECLVHAPFTVVYQSFRTPAEGLFFVFCDPAESAFTRGSAISASWTLCVSARIDANPAVTVSTDRPT